MDLNGFTCLIFSSFSGPMWTIASSTYVYYTTIIVKGAVHKWRCHFFNPHVTTLKHPCIIKISSILTPTLYTMAILTKIYFYSTSYSPTPWDSRVSKQGKMHYKFELFSTFFNFFQFISTFFNFFQIWLNVIAIIQI